MKIPYLQTSIATDLLMTFLLMPVWWVIGVNVYIYQFVSGLVFLKLIAESIKTNRALAISTPITWVAIFLCVYMASLVINMQYNPIQRVLASLNNYGIFVMGLLMMTAIYNAVDDSYFENYFRACRWLCIFTVGIAVIFLLMWLVSVKLETFSLLGLRFPHLKDYPFFYVQWSIRSATSDWTMSNIPRLGIYSDVYIATGGFMAMLFPLSLAYGRCKKEDPILFWGIAALATIPLFFSLSRMAMMALIASFVVVEFIDKKAKPYWVLIYAGTTVLVMSSFVKFMGWLFHARSHSTFGRLELYNEAYRMVMDENPLLGIGIRPRSEFNTMIVGSHSHYVELLLVTGFIGLITFLIFQFLVFIIWYQQRDYLVTDEQKIAWKALGVSYLAANGILLTGGLDSLPFIAYTFFLIAGGILGLGRLLNQVPVPEKKGVSDVRYRRAI